MNAVAAVLLIAIASKLIRLSFVNKREKKNSEKEKNL
jgi:hypothetical protein